MIYHLVHSPFSSIPYLLIFASPPLRNQKLPTSDDSDSFASSISFVFFFISNPHAPNQSSQILALLLSPLSSKSTKSKSMCSTSHAGRVMGVSYSFKKLKGALFIYGSLIEGGFRMALSALPEAWASIRRHQILGFEDKRVCVAENRYQ